MCVKQISAHRSLPPRNITTAILVYISYIPSALLATEHRIGFDIRQSQGFILRYLTQTTPVVHAFSPAKFGPGVLSPVTENPVYDDENSNTSLAEIQKSVQPLPTVCFTQ